MKNVKEKLLEIALAELADGVAEVQGPKSNPRIAEYLSSVNQPGNDEIAWCSAFVNWCVIRAGLEGTNSAAARSWLKWGQPAENFQFGSILVMSRGTSSWQGHVGFYLGLKAGQFLLLGGNQGDRLSLAYFPLGKVLGLREIHPN